MMNPKIATRRVSLLLLFFMFCASAVVAQTTAFSYQGRLTDGGAPANGTYDLQFTLYNASSTAIPSPLVREDVTVTNGIFTVQLDFGASVFTNGQASTLEIGVRPGTATGAFTILSPRQPITATPYAIQTLNASQLGGVDASQYLQTNGNGSGLTNLNAGNIATGTISNARLGLIPTANIADSAVTAPKIASGQIVKSLNGLTDSVTLAGSGNITVTPTGNTLTIASTGGGVGGGGTTNTIPVWSNGTTLGNSGIRQSVNGVQLPNGVQLDAGAQGNQVQFGSPNGETGMTISGTSGRADIRYNGTLKLVAGPVGFVPPDTNGIAITPQGLVGIGTTTPALLSGGTGKLVSISDTLNPGIALTNTNTGGKQFFLYSNTTGVAGGGSLRVFDATSGADRLVIQNDGNLTQPRSNNGLVKAMIYVNANGTIARCYNGITNSSAGNCGFSSTREFQGEYRIDFGFQVNDRFYALTLVSTGIIVRRIGYLVTDSSSANRLINIISDPSSGVDVDNDFVIIVY